jgi:polyhydroxybutyrate depolymerase
MMCYRLAAELPGRFAAIAPVAGTMTVDMPPRPRPISVMHFHGTADTLVPYGGPDDTTPDTVRFLSVDETVRAWARANGCPSEPTIIDEPDRRDDRTTVRRFTFGPGKHDTEVILYRIEGGGHTWPGNDTVLKKVLGTSTHDISANDLIWEFFRKHPQP